MRKYIKISYITLFIIIIWDALHAYILPFSGSGYILLCLVLVGVSNEMRYKNFWKNLNSEPYKYWFIWIIYTLINTFYITGYYSDISKSTFIFLVFQSFFVLLLISNKRYPILHLINLFMWAFFVRILFSLFFDSFTSLGNDETLRLGEEFNANQIALGGLFLIILIGVKKLFTNKLSSVNYIQFVFALYIIAITSSRSAAIAAIFVILSYIYVYRSKNLLKRYFKYFIVIILVFLSSIYTLNNTPIGARFVESFHKTINADSPEVMFDSRMGQYLQGINQFKNNPINGVGLHNFSAVGPVEVTAHSEYIVLFAESGIIGVLIAFIFYRHIFVSIRKRKKNNVIDKRICEYFIFVMMTMLFVMTSTWVYIMSIFWIPIGIIIKYYKFEVSKEYLS